MWSDAARQAGVDCLAEIQKQDAKPGSIRDALRRLASHCGGRLPDPGQKLHDDYRRAACVDADQAAITTTREALMVWLRNEFSSQPIKPTVPTPSRAAGSSTSTTETK